MGFLTYAISTILLNLQMLYLPDKDFFHHNYNLLPFRITLVGLAI